MPDTVDAYTHRIGRTGRAELTGEAFTFVQPADELTVRAIEKVLGEPLERRRLPDFDYGGFVPERSAAPARQNHTGFGNRSRRGARPGASSGPAQNYPAHRAAPGGSRPGAPMSNLSRRRGPRPVGRPNS
jgi:ATP-dependent RNA helicase RhlE